MSLPLPSQETPIVRIPSPTPTAVEARGNVDASQTRFRHLCARGSQAEIEDLLEEWINPISSLNVFRATFSSNFASPLCEAARHGHRSLLEYLASRGFPLFDSGPETVSDAATSGAAQTGDTKVLELLLELGWDLNSPGSSSGSAISRALNNEDIIRWFLDHGADPNGACSYGCTATTAAAQSSPFSVMKLLVERGGTIAGTDVIALAALGHNNGHPGRLEVVEYLLDNGAPIDTYLFANSFKEVPSMISMYGLETALQLAARGGKKDMVELLLKRGADKNNKGCYSASSYIKGGTALQIAQIKGFDGIISLLREDKGHSNSV